jgi:uncharacterized protein YdaU (DUF1376 family)
MRYYKHHIGDYAAATQHLSFVEDAAYRRMIGVYYQTERPLPADIKRVARLVGARTRSEQAAVEAVLAEFFILEDDGWHQRRCDEELQKSWVKSKSAVSSGLQGGRPRKSSKPLKDKETEKAFAFQTESTDTPDENLPHHPITPLPHNNDFGEAARTSSARARDPTRGSPQPSEEPDPPGPMPAFLDRRPSQLPDDWWPTEEVRLRAERARPDIGAEFFEKRILEFKNYCRHSAKRSFDFDSYFVNFLVGTNVKPTRNDPEERGLSAALAGYLGPLVG